MNVSNDLGTSPITGLICRRALVSLFWFWALAPSLRADTLGDARISEFLASNGDGLRDGDGDRSDWIEIRNDSGSHGDLGGWFLTDDPENLTKWTFPAIEIASGDYLVVFASGKNHATLGEPLHCNFKLSADAGGYLALVKPDGVTVASEYAGYPEQFSDISYGEAVGVALPGFFPLPTPGVENGLRFDGITADTKFSIDRGLFEAPFELAITTSTTGATIRYTTDGSLPSETAGIIYTAPIPISSTTGIRAMAYKVGFYPTDIDTHTYIFPADVPGQQAMSSEITGDPVYGPQMVDALTSIPTIALSFAGTDIDRTEIAVSVELLNFEDGPMQVDAGAVRYGGYVADYLKRSFRLHFRSQYGPGRLEYPLFDGFDYDIPPTRDFDSLELRAGNQDMLQRGAYLSNRFTDDSMIEMGNIAPHGRFVHVYFNGEYHGQYHLRERWNAAMLASYFAGDEEEYDAVNANNVGCCVFGEGELQDGDLRDWNQIKRLLNLNGLTPYRTTRDLLDVPNLIDFMLLWTSGRAESEFRAAGSAANGVGFKFFIKDADGHLRPTGLWEVNHDGPLNAMTRFRSEGDPDFKILLADRIHKHFFNGGALTPERNIARLQRRVDETALSYIAESARWRIIDTLNSNPGPQLNRTPVAWQAYQDDIIDNQFPTLSGVQLAKLRAAGMYPDIVAPVLSQHGGSLPPGGAVTMSTDATSIYYTTDGSDPRSPGGAISPGAVLAPFSGDVPTSQDFVASGARWHYLDDGTDQGSAWRETGFDDSIWAEGASELGYTEGDEATLVGFIDTNPDRLGFQRNATTYFRHKVNIGSPSAYSEFVIQLKYDDAAAVYINGNEVIRTANLPAAAAFDTYATGSTPDEGAFFRFTIPTSVFVDGQNTIAVEIHNKEGSSDLSFDFTLRGEVESGTVNVTEPVVLAGAGPFNARAFNSSTGGWSALTSTFFSIDSTPATPTNLAISEIHYHPAEPASPAEIAISADRDDYEFIELLNLGNQPIDLTGVYFSDGITFAFPDNTLLEASARAVVVRDIEAFTGRYGGMIPIAGVYSGRLSNDGERLALSLSGVGQLREVTYNDQIPWPRLADGYGYSLVLREQTGDSDHSIAESWAAHTIIGGAPGSPDSFRTGGYAAWKAENGISDDAEDGDGDGLVAIVEYALGSDPMIPSPSARPTPGVTGIGDDQFLTISYDKNPDATDITIQLQFSTDLATWHGIAAIEVAPNTFRTETPIGDATAQFLRISISETPAP